jgi:N-acetylglucosaminyldiphosphoundecaprenol N-acetyl-beta-D-mannosaminyltransferase
MKEVFVLGVKILPVNLEKAFREVIEQVMIKAGGFFCLVNIHVVMEFQKDPKLLNMINRSTANFPDGKGLVMGLYLLGSKVDFKVRGTDLMLKLCGHASQKGLAIFLYGNTEKTLNKLRTRLCDAFHGIKIAGSISPPFRSLTKKEDDTIVREINDADPDILFVSLGAPKQERWMAEHNERIKAVQLGVGAAFDFIAGEIREAPLWMQKAPLEWLHRMAQQPGKTTARMMKVPGFFYKILWQCKTRANR